MPVCAEPSGTVKRWVCPYHQWSYGLDGRLLGCAGLEENLDPRDYGLHRAAVTEVGGLVFVWLAGRPSGSMTPDATSARLWRRRGSSAREQDWALCERNHTGVGNPAFTPGPY